MDVAFGVHTRLLHLAFTFGVYVSPELSLAPGAVAEEQPCLILVIRIVMIVLKWLVSGQVVRIVMMGLKWYVSVRPDVYVTWMHARADRVECAKAHAGVFRRVLSISSHHLFCFPVFAVL